jgi:N-formylglutamate amidohydrolase
MSDGYFEVLAPAHWNVPAVFNSPHSGSIIPPSLLNLSRLTVDELRQSEDSHVDALFSGCQRHGIPLLRALASRAYLDLNREPYELDARMFHESLPGFMNPGSPRVGAGFGTVPRYVSEGEEIYRGRIALAEAVARIDTYYRPYHRMLGALLDAAHEAMGFVLLVDCHSMPSSAVKSRSFSQSVDIVMGDRYGVSCARDLSQEIESFFASQGLKVARNKPYAGGFITENYAAPHQNRHVVQIEVNRALYMNESTLAQHAGFGRLQAILTEFTKFVGVLLSDVVASPAHKLAAE